MLHYYMHDGPAAFRFELAGDLDADAAARLEQDWRTAASTIGKRTLIVDLSFVTAIDEAGRSLFRRWHAAGAQFAAISARSRELVEAITGLPFSKPAAATPTYSPWFSLGLRSLSISAIPLFMLLTMLTPPLALAADDGANMAFARYVSNFEKLGPAESADVAVHIDASVPKLNKRARLDAIRRPGVDGEPQYLILNFEGDGAVKREVIARYLALEQQASAAPAASFAITPENYKFRYAGSIESGGSKTYIFNIKARRHGRGFMDGQIWIDQATGALVHQEGRLAKTSSIFIKGIQIERETGARVPFPYVRVTHVSVETRWFGPAELTIREGPSTPTSNAGDFE